MMLQQTRVETVIPYFERFVTRFPDVGALAAAPEEEVLESWSGLGYYRRARMLAAGAREVVARHGGRFPDDERAALALPGIGRYAAGAIRSIALGARAPVLDGNVTRVLTRVFGIRGDPSRAPVRGLLWRIAGRVVERGDPGELNQAQMELGAIVCAPRDPDCERCPLAALCVARREGIIEDLPELRPRRRTVEVACTVLLVRHGDAVLLRRRLPGELLPGMWDLPGAFTGTADDRSTGIAAAGALLPWPVEAGRTLGTVKHAITYRRISLEVREASPAEPFRERRAAGGRRGPDGAELTWLPGEEALGKALSAPARKVIRRWGLAPGPEGDSA
jgi:A/G-specific adenine glycosylase